MLIISPIDDSLDEWNGADYFWVPQLRRAAHQDLGIQAVAMVSSAAFLFHLMD